MCCTCACMSIWILNITDPSKWLCFSSTITGARRQVHPALVPDGKYCGSSRGDCNQLHIPHWGRWNRTQQGGRHLRLLLWYVWGCFHESHGMYIRRSVYSSSLPLQCSHNTYFLCLILAWCMQSTEVWFKKCFFCRQHAQMLSWPGDSFAGDLREIMSTCASNAKVIDDYCTWVHVVISSFNVYLHGGKLAIFILVLLSQGLYDMHAHA